MGQDGSNPAATCLLLEFRSIVRRRSHIPGQWGSRVSVHLVGQTHLNGKFVKVVVWKLSGPHDFSQDFADDRAMVVFIPAAGASRAGS
jgi:hypothetical protein